MNCNKKNNTFNIGQPGEDVPGCLTIYSPLDSGSIMESGVAIPPLILDVTDTSLYTTSAGGYLYVNVPAGTYIAQASVSQQHLETTYVDVVYNIKKVEGGVTSIVPYSTRITSLGEHLNYFMQNHINTESFTLNTSGTIYLAFGKTANVNVECQAATLNVIKID